MPLDTASDEADAARASEGARVQVAPHPAEASYERLARLALDLGSQQDLLGVYRRLREFVADGTPMSGMFVSSYDAGTRMRTCVYAYSEGEELDPATFPPMPPTGSPHSLAVETGETIVTRDFQSAMTGKPRFNVGLDRDNRLPESSIVVPMVAHGRILGGMEIQSVQADAFREPDVALLQMAAHLAALAAENVRSIDREKALREQIEDRAAELEKRVRDRTRELAAKNRELEAFSFTVAHDLRAPLRAVLNLSEFLVQEHGKELRPALRDDLAIILHSSRKMASLVEDLLRFARTSQGGLQRQLVDMTAIARRIADDLRAAEPGRKARVLVQDNLIARGDEALLRVVLDNLLGNAWKYTSRAEEAVIEVGARIQGGEIVYFVRDNGAGFDPAEAGRLFGAFQRLHNPNEYEGTGIGLATVKRIVERHGGRVWAQSEVGRGATFFFTIPSQADP